MKKQLPLILTLLGGGYLIYWLRRKASAGANLQYIPLDIAIDSRKSGLFRIYYSLKLRLINNESANVNIRAINLKAFIDNKFIGDILSNASFNVPAKGTQDIKLDTSISTGSVARLVFDALTEGINFSMNVNGYIDTDLGRVNVNFTKQVGEQGISEPIISNEVIYEPIGTDNWLISTDLQFIGKEFKRSNPNSTSGLKRYIVSESTLEKMKKHYNMVRA